MSDAPAPTAVEVREAAVRLLARREHSLVELETKLARKGWPDALVADAVADLVDAGLQSDRRFAEAFARQRAERCYGPRRIEAELRQRGVDRALIAESLETLEIDFSGAAARFYRRRYGNDSQSSLDYRERARRAQVMARRGFEAEHVRPLIGD